MSCFFSLLALCGFGFLTTSVYAVETGTKSISYYFGLETGFSSSGNIPSSGGCPNTCSGNMPDQDADCNCYCAIRSCGPGFSLMLPLVPVFRNVLKEWIMMVTVVQSRDMMRQIAS